MANYTINMTLSELLTIFNKYLKIENQLLKISVVNKDNIKEFMENINLSDLSDKDINTLQGIIFNKFNPETYSNEVPDDEEDYCWNIGKEIFNRCNNELAIRHKDDENIFSRTNAKH